LALGFAAVTPVGGAPDEGAHLRYVEVLATEGRLPVLDLAHRREVGTADREYEAHQPPLYYTLAVPFYHVGKAFGGAAGAGQACRFLSVLIGLAGTLLVWRLAREVAPGRPGLALAATAFAALLPMRLSVMGSVTNDGLAEVLATASLLVMLRLPRAGAGGEARAGLVLGVALALALLARATAILLLPPALLALYLASGMREGGADRPAALRRFLVAGGATALPVLVLAGWWFARNHVLYGDPLGQRVFTEYFADTPHCDDFRQPPFNLTYGEYWVKLVLPTTVATFWGAFGHLDQPALFMGNYVPGSLAPPWGGLVGLLEPFWPVWDHQGKVYIPYRSWVYPLLVLATLGAGLGWGVAAARRRSRAGAKKGKAGVDPPAGPPSARLILGAHAVFVAAAFLNFNATYFQGQGRYLLPALGAISLALAAGWLGWRRSRPDGGGEERAAWVVVAGMAALAAYALFGVALPGFAGASP